MWQPEIAAKAIPNFYEDEVLCRHILAKYMVEDSENPKFQRALNSSPSNLFYSCSANSSRRFGSRNYQESGFIAAGRCWTSQLVATFVRSRRSHHQEIFPQSYACGGATASKVLPQPRRGGEDLRGG
jgi:hypothetical protein